MLSITVSASKSTFCLRKTRRGLILSLYSSYRRLATAGFRCFRSWRRLKLFQWLAYRLQRSFCTCIRIWLSGRDCLSCFHRICCSCTYTKGINTLTIDCRDVSSTEKYSISGRNQPKFNPRVPDFHTEWFPGTQWSVYRAKSVLYPQMSSLQCGQAKPWVRPLSWTQGRELK